MGGRNHHTLRLGEQKPREPLGNGMEQHVLDHGDEASDALGVVAQDDASSLRR
jgi:hypothetical protein